MQRPDNSETFVKDIHLSIQKWEIIHTLAIQKQNQSDLNKSHLLFILENEACLLENANFFKVWLYQLDLLISSENF